MTEPPHAAPIGAVPEGRLATGATIALRAVDAAHCFDRRVAFLSRLPFFQELYVEWLLDDGSTHLIEVGGRGAGHVGIDRDGRLLEFDLDDACLPLQDEVFDFVLAKLRIGAAIVKSFDRALMACCAPRAAAVKPIGCLFRSNDIDKTVELDAGFVVRDAGPGDYPSLVEQTSGLYESERELQRMLEHRQIVLFHKDGTLVGCGFRIRIHPAFDFVDIGMWISPARRGQGYAKQIVGHLRRRCLADGQKPICGCAIDNAASRKALEANGYVATHRLLEYRLTTPPGPLTG